jgi:hypothetical protein
VRLRPSRRFPLGTAQQFHPHQFSSGLSIILCDPTGIAARILVESNAWFN